MSEIDAGGETDALAGIVARLDELSRDVRKQGRAAVAAQAAAESCLEAVRALDHQTLEDADSVSRIDVERAHYRESERWLRAIVPLVDAISRTAREAERVVGRKRPRRWWWPFATADERVEVTALSDGLVLLVCQIDATLEGLGVEIERPVGLVDAARHRVVEARPGTGEPAGAILEVVRVGYRLDGRSIRDADVVAVARTPSSHSSRPDFVGTANAPKSSPERTDP